MSCSSRLRAQLNHEIEEALASSEELRPFMSAWSVIEGRFQGIAAVDDSLDPVTQIHCLLMQELTRTALVTEEVFISWLMSLKALKKNVVCSQTACVWEPVMEPFSEFVKRSSADIKLSDCLNNTEKLKEFTAWVIKLCNWDGSSVANQSLNLH